MNAPKSLLNIMHRVKSELQEFCYDYNWIKSLVSLVKRKGCGFSVKSRDGKHLWLTYKDVYIAFNLENDKRSISFWTSGSDDISESERFRRDEKVFSCLLNDLTKLKK